MPAKGLEVSNRRRLKRCIKIGVPAGRRSATSPAFGLQASITLNTEKY